MDYNFRHLDPGPVGGPAADPRMSKMLRRHWLNKHIGLRMGSFWGPTKTRSEAAAGAGVADRWGHQKSSKCKSNVGETSTSG